MVYIQEIAAQTRCHSKASRIPGQYNLLTNPMETRRLKIITKIIKQIIPNPIVQMKGGIKPRWPKD